MAGPAQWPALARHSAAVLDSLLTRVEGTEGDEGATVESQLARANALERDEPRRPSRTHRPPDRLRYTDRLPPIGIKTRTSKRMQPRATPSEGGATSS